VAHPIGSQRSTASCECLEACFRQGDEAARGTILAAFQAWGWRADPQLDAARPPGILSSVAAAPGASPPFAHTPARSVVLQGKLHSLADSPQTCACSLLNVKVSVKVNAEVAGPAASYLHQRVPSLHSVTGPQP
jgi:hypothetical protein